MIVAFVGAIDKAIDCPISGNGKTCSMTGVSYLDYKNKKKTIWTNYYTDFSERVCGLQEMINEIGNDRHDNLILSISEMGQILNSIGSKNKQVLFIEKFVSQIRKLHIEMYYDAQRFRSIHVRLREFTDVIYIPKKYHYDGEECNYNLCNSPHMVGLYAYKPPKEGVRIMFDAVKVGQHYNTDELVFDKILLGVED